MALSLRLDPATEARIRRYADRTGKSKSDVVREAMELFFAAEAAEAKAARSMKDRLRRVIGAVDSGGMNYSVDTHEKYRAALIEKHRGRRSR